MIDIQPTTDPNLLAELNKEVQEWHHTHYPDIFKPYNKAAVLPFYESMLSQPGTRAWVALDNSTPVGYAFCFVVHQPENPFQHEKKYVLLDQVLVMKENRGRSIGLRLLDTVIAFAQSQDIHRIELNPWTDNNEARSFFSSHGFMYCSERMMREV